MLDEKGRCCGRKPLVYKRAGTLFCWRCDSEYNLATKQQQENWAWVALPDGTFTRRLSNQNVTRRISHAD